MKRVSIVLLVAALAIGLAGCNTSGFIPQYTIKISSTMGGSVTTPGEGLFHYPAGTTINLVAEEDRGYEFSSWISNLSTIADTGNTTTSVVLNKNNCFIYANFRR